MSVGSIPIPRTKKQGFALFLVRGMGVLNNPAFVAAQIRQRYALPEVPSLLSKKRAHRRVFLRCAQRSGSIPPCSCQNKKSTQGAFFILVRGMGIEPTWRLVHTALNRARLPVPPPSHIVCVFRYKLDCNHVASKSQ